MFLVENGRSVPRFGVIQKLSAALGVEPSEIVEFADAIRSAAEGRGRRRDSLRSDGSMNPGAEEPQAEKESGV